MLDPEAADDAAREDRRRRAPGRSRARGTLDRADDWGMRKMAYEIDQRNEADYRCFQLPGRARPARRLDHSLKITDGVLRFRIFKVDPDAPTQRRRPPPSARRRVGERPRPRPRRDRAAPRDAATTRDVRS